MNRAEPYMLDRGGEIADLNGLALKAGAAQTAGAVSVYEGGLPARTAGPPLHVHNDADEALYILEGEVTIQLGQQTIRADAGAFVWMPRGVPHTFANAGLAPARMLGLAVPGGMEDLLAAVPRDGRPADPAALAVFAAKYGSRTVGPPLSPERLAGPAPRAWTPRHPLARRFRCSQEARSRELLPCSLRRSS
jgi:mannose-6-phosphate isomerase-like protein (cupin superfamily)